MKMAMAMFPCSWDPRRDVNQPTAAPTINAGMAATEAKALAENGRLSDQVKILSRDESPLGWERKTRHNAGVLREHGEQVSNAHTHANSAALGMAHSTAALSGLAKSLRQRARL